MSEGEGQRVALVTGGAIRLGRAIALGLAIAAGIGILGGVYAPTLLEFMGAESDVVDLTLISLGSTGYVPFPPPPTPPTKHVRATVFAPNGAAVRTFDSNNLTSLTLAETGTYAVRVWATAMGETGPYHLGLECLSLRFLPNRLQAVV